MTITDVTNTITDFTKGVEFWVLGVGLEGRGDGGVGRKGDGGIGRRGDGKNGDYETLCPLRKSFVPFVVKTI